MNQLTVVVLQLGLLVLLWLFVLGVVGVLRRDLFGSRTTAPGAPSASAVPADAPPARPEPVRPAPPRPAPAPAASTRPRQLVVLEGPLAGTRLDLHDSPVLMGRSQDCTLVLGDDYASGHHARLLPAPGSASGWLLEDLGSTNGTSLGRGEGAQRVTGSVPVGAGSVVKVGRTVVELRG